MADAPCTLALPLQRDMLGADPFRLIVGTLSQAGLLPEQEPVRHDSTPLTRWHLGTVLGTDLSVMFDGRADLWYLEVAAPNPSAAAVAEAELQAVLPVVALISLCDAVVGGGAAPGHYLALGLAARGGSGPAGAILARALEQEEVAMLPFAVEAAALSGDPSLCAALSRITRRHNAPEVARAVALARTMLGCPQDDGDDGA